MKVRCDWNFSWPWVYYFRSRYGEGKILWVGPFEFIWGKP